MKENGAVINGHIRKHGNNRVPPRESADPPVMAGPAGPDPGPRRRGERGMLTPIIMTNTCATP